MMEFIDQVVRPETITAIIIAVLAFFAVISLLKPLMARSDLKERMDRVALEREKMRAQQKAELDLSRSQRNKKLREKPNGVIAEIVSSLRLHELLNAESYRDKMRMAGLRQEKHMVMFLAARVILPIVLVVFGYAYLGAMKSGMRPELRIAMTMAMGVAGFYLPTLWLANRIQKRQKSIREAWSDALDLMLISVESGMSIEVAMTRVAEEIGTISPALAEELKLTTAELSFLGDRSKAYENLGKRTGLPTVKAVVNSLIQAETYGTSLGLALRNAAEENRAERMADLEKKAASLQSKLTIPMVLCFLPVIFVVFMGPAAIVAFELP